jgi:hypothetical protein
LKRFGIRKPTKSALASHSSHRSEAKIILDHFEGVEPNDVTGRFYSADLAIGRKRETMEKWIAWLEHWCAEAIREDGLLMDSKALAEKIFKSRYGDERWAQKTQPNF